MSRKINHLHMRSLRIGYRDNESLFHELLQKDHTSTIHQRNIQRMAVELYKVKENLSN